MKRILNHTKPDKINIRKYLRLTEKLPNNQSELSILISTWAVQKSKEINAPLLTTIALEQLGQVYLETDKYIEASKCLIKALEIAEKNKFYTEQVETLRLLAGVNSTNEQEPKAIEYLEKCISLCKKHNIVTVIGKAYLTLGSVTLNLKSRNKQDASEGIKFCKMGLPLILKNKDTTNAIRAYEIIAQIHFYQDQPDSAMAALDKAYFLINLTNNEEAKLGYLNNKGNGYSIQNKHKEAIIYFKEGLELSKKFKSPSWEYLFCFNLAYSYEKLNQYKLALDYASSYIRIHDSLTDKENFAAAADIQNKYEREKKENEILKLNKANEIKRIQLDASNQKRKQLAIFLFSALGALALLVILAILLLKNIQSKKRAYAELEEKNLDIQRQSILLSKQAKLIAQFQSQMNPHFVFNALHNIQGLVISNEDKKATKQIQALAQLMRKTFANAEKEDITIEEEINYLQKYVEFEIAALDYQITFSITLDPLAENALIPPMMIQPFVENAIKHAQLKNVNNPFIKVHIGTVDQLLKITVQDNGIGFDAEKENLEKLSHSVSVIKSRIELLFQAVNIINTNSFETKSNPGQGTLVNFYLPLNYSF